MAHQFCTFHKIAYNDELDAHCPQCIIGRVAGAEQLEYDTKKKAPVNADGAPLDVRTLKPVA